MTSPDDRIAELEKKLVFFQDCHRDQIRYLSRRICELQHELDQLSSVRTELQAVEQLALDAYAASNEDAQDTLSEVNGIVPLDTPALFFNQLPAIREARRKS
jgi:hypothetical protein